MSINTISFSKVKKKSSGLIEEGICQCIHNVKKNKCNRIKSKANCPYFSSISSRKSLSCNFNADSKQSLPIYIFSFIREVSSREANCCKRPQMGRQQFNPLQLQFSPLLLTLFLFLFWDWNSELWTKAVSGSLLDSLCVQSFREAALGSRWPDTVSHSEPESSIPLKISVLPAAFASASSLFLHLWLRIPSKHYVYVR